MVITRRSRMWNGLFLAALLLSLLGALVAPSPVRAGTDPPDSDRDERHTPLAVEVTLAELPSVGKSAEATIVVSSTEPASGVRVEIVGSDGLRIDGERVFVIDLRDGEAHTLQTRVTPEAAGNHSVAANVNLDFGDGTVWGNSDGVYFYSDDGSASEGFRYMGDPMSGEAAPGPGNTMEFESEAFPDGSMPAIPIDENVEIPVDTGEPGKQNEDPRAGEVALAAGMLKIRGNVGVTHRDGTWQPQKQLVELLTSGGSHIAFTYSDFNGQFVFNVNNPGKFRIRVRAYYRHNTMTIGALRVVLNGIQTSNGFSLAGWNYTLPTMGPVPDGEVFVGTWRPSPNWLGHRAWWVYQDLIDGFFSTWNQTPPGVPAGSRQPDGVTAEWQPGSSTGPHYNRNSRRIRLRDIDANSHNMVVHEYGHAVMHNVYSNMPVNDCPANGHSIPRASGVICAWTEGWANFFAIFVAGDPVFTHGCALPCTPPATDLEFRFSGGQWHDGDLVEGNVAASLWDFIDAQADGSDKTTSAVTPFWKIWDTLYNHDHNTFHAFWDGLSANFNYSTFAQGLASLHQNTIDYGWPAVCGDWFKEADDTHLGFASVALPEFPPDQRYFCTDQDIDWYLLNVEAGEIYLIETSNLSTVTNGTIADTTLTLYRVNSDDSFTQVAYDDNGGSQNLASRIVYTAPASGEYRIAVRHRYGVGHPFYSYTFDVTLVTDNDPPTVTAPTHELYAGTTLGNPEAGVYTLDVRAAWTASDPDDSVAFQSLYGQVDEQGFAPIATAIAPTTQHHIVPLTIGTTNQLQVSATDTYGATSDYATGESFEVVGIQEKTCTFEGQWTSHDAGYAWGGSYMSTDGSASPMIAAAASTPEGAYALCSFTGESVGLVGIPASDGGVAQIYIDGELHGKADFYSLKPGNRQVLFAVNGLEAGEHVLEVRWTNTNNEWSSGYQLYLDGLIALD